MLFPKSIFAKIQVSRNSVIKMFELLDKGGILRCIHSGWQSPKSVAKPEKILFNNTDIMGALSSQHDISTRLATTTKALITSNLPHKKQKI